MCELNNDKDSDKFYRIDYSDIDPVQDWRKLLLNISNNY